MLNKNASSTTPYFIFIMPSIEKIAYLNVKNTFFNAFNFVQEGQSLISNVYRNCSEKYLIKIEISNIVKTGFNLYTKALV